MGFNYKVHSHGFFLQSLNCQIICLCFLVLICLLVSAYYRLHTGGVGDPQKCYDRKPKSVLKLTLKLLSYMEQRNATVCNPVPGNVLHSHAPFVIRGWYLR